MRKVHFVSTKQATPLMPHATASWLIDNTGLTFEQIAEFCGLHMLEVQAMADDLAGAKYTGSVQCAAATAVPPATQLRRCHGASQRRAKQPLHPRHGSLRHELAAASDVRLGSMGWWGGRG